MWRWRRSCSRSCCWPALPTVIPGLRITRARLSFQPSLIGLLTTLFYANLLLLISNILPAFPMDGGRVFRAALSGPLSGRQTATRVAEASG